MIHFKNNYDQTVVKEEKAEIFEPSLYTQFESF